LAALAVACRDVDVRNVKALIIGPFETPYEFGFFEVRNDWVLAMVKW
jgi:ubiquitin-conjugating enzyme E2 Z